MSALNNVTTGYGKFFLGCADFAFFPYTRTFFGIANTPREGASIAEAIIATVFLSTVIPILPALFTVTSSLALFALSLALSVMPFMYFGALVADIAADQSPRSHQHGSNCAF